MESLRTSYGRLKKGLPSGSGARKLSSRSQWILDKLHYLHPYIKHRDTVSNLSDEEEENDNESANVVEVQNTGSDESGDDAPLATLREKSRDDTDVQEIDNVEGMENAQTPAAEASQMHKAPPGTHTRKPLPKKPSSVQTAKTSRNKALKRLESHEETCSNVLRSVSTTIEDFGKKFLSDRDEPKKQKDEITACVESLEVKLRTIKSRELRLRLIDGVERLAFKFLLEDYCHDTNLMQQSYNTNMAYCPPAVQPVSPPTRYYQTQSTQNTLTASLLNPNQNIATTYAGGGLQVSGTSVITALNPGNLQTTTASATVTSTMTNTTEGVADNATDVLADPSTQSSGSSLITLQNAALF